MDKLKASDFSFTSTDFLSFSDYVKGKSGFQNFEVCIKLAFLSYKRLLDSLKEDFTGKVIFTEVTMPRS